MAHLEIRVGVDHHLTLVHFETMTTTKADAIVDALTPIVSKVRNPPVGRFGRPAMMGRSRNIPAILIESPYVRTIRGAVVEALVENKISYSKGFDFTPHVTAPLAEWREGESVPFSPWIDLMWKELPAPISFELWAAPKPVE